MSHPHKARLVLQALLRWATHTRAHSWSFEHWQGKTKLGDRKAASGTGPRVKQWPWEQVWASSPGQIATYQGARPSHGNEQDLRTGAELCYSILPTASFWFLISSQWKCDSSPWYKPNKGFKGSAIKKIKWMSHMLWGVNVWGLNWS